jgi:2-oxo-4-hydroxy-4-carboxy-5-ureidoimidazoline decarboxylase
MMIDRRTWSSLIGALTLALMFVLLPGPCAIAGPADMAPVNAMDRAAFVQKFGGIFENSPWVAEQAWDKRPFASLDDMHAAMVAVAK